MVPDMSIDEAFATAKAHIQAGRLDQAEATYRQILALHSNHALAHYNLANLLRRVGRSGEAIAEYEHALAARPQFPEAMNNLGLLLQEQGEVDRAIELFRQAIALRPDYADALSHLGVALGRLGQHAEAIVSCERAVGLRPDSPEFHNNLAICLNAAGRIDLSLVAAQRAVALRGDFGDAWSNLGAILCDLGRVEEAVQCYDRALAIRPDAKVETDRIFALLRDERQDAAANLAACRDWDQRYAIALTRSAQPHDNDRSPDRRLRVGYVSPDFRRHVVGWNLVALLANHNHEQFEVICYSATRQRDDLTDRFAAWADGWREIAGLNDEEAAELIRTDRIDILVDLALHMGGSRLLVFARKPAPVQVTFMGYPGTTGLSAIDYRLTDPYLDPPGRYDADYSEQSVRLPDTFWCYDPAADAQVADILPSSLPALNTGHMTFGCLNDFGKVSDSSLALWAKVLAAVPGSQLLMLAPEGSARQRVLDRLAAGGIEPGRIEFTGRLSRPDYLRLYHRIDLALDTVPYNAHSTALDGYWMGVPTVTRMGATVASRAGFSQLSNLGLTELAAHSDDEFVRIATELARDLPRLKELRAGLRERVRRSPLMDGKRFASDIEAAYRQMWRRWCNRSRGGA
jgi:protein O-GlcNAc transferase